MARSKSKIAKNAKALAAKRASIAAHPASREDQRAEAATVAWMLALLAATLGDALGLIGLVVMPVIARGAEHPGMALALPRLLLFVAAASGLVFVLLIPVVYRLRKDPPPAAITWFGVGASLLPVLVLLGLALRA